METRRYTSTMEPGPVKTGNALGSVAALSNTNGTLVEPYRDSVFGETEIRDSKVVLRTSSFCGNPYLFTGRRPGQWPWCSLAIRCGREAEMPLDAGPKRLPTDWLELVQAAVETPEQETIEHCIKRGCPYGSQQWIQTTSTELGLESTLRSRGRPRKDS